MSYSKLTANTSFLSNAILLTILLAKQQMDMSLQHSKYHNIPFIPLPLPPPPHLLHYPARLNDPKDE